MHRFWHYALPQLPPKLQPVDAVLVEDVSGHLADGLQSVCQQMPELLNPEGVCVVVLGTGKGSTSLEHVKAWLKEAGLVFGEEAEVQTGSSSVARAGVWFQQHA